MAGAAPVPRQVLVMADLCNPDSGRLLGGLAASWCGSPPCAVLSTRGSRIQSSAFCVLVGGVLVGVLILITQGLLAIIKEEAR